MEVTAQRNSRLDLAVAHPVAFLAESAVAPLRFRRWHDRSIGFQLYARGLQQRLERGPTILEEGVILEIWRGLVNGSLVDEPWQELLAQPFADLVVVVDAEDRIVEERLSQRSSNPGIAQRLTEAPPGGQLWRRTADARAMVLDRVRQVVPVERVPNQGSIDHAIERATLAIRPQMRYGTVLGPT